MHLDRLPRRAERGPLSVAQLHLAGEEQLASGVAVLERLGLRNAVVARPAQAVRHHLVEHHEVARGQRDAHAGVRHHEFDGDHVHRQDPEQAARPVARHVVVEARAARGEVVDAGGDAALIVGRIVAEHAGDAQGARDRAHEIGNARRGGEAVQRRGGIVDRERLGDGHPRVARSRQARACRGVEEIGGHHVHASVRGARVVRVARLVAAHGERAERLGHRVHVGRDDAMSGRQGHAAIVGAAAGRTSKRRLLELDLPP